MGKFAQYRHRGSYVQGYLAPPPINTDWTAVQSTTHVQVASASAGPGGLVTKLLAETYLVPTAFQINETFSMNIFGTNTGAFVYSPGNVVGARVAWADANGVQRSGWSAEKQTLFV